MELLGIKRAAEVLGIAVSTLRFYAEKGRIGRKVDGRWIFTSNELAEFKAKPRKPGRPPGYKPPEGPPLRVEIDPRSRIAIKDKRTRPKDDKGREGEIEY